jgi:hypothetical protein
MTDISSKGVNQDILLTWTGTLPRFSPMTEGGPGKLSSLIFAGLSGLLLCAAGIYLTGISGVDGPGPAMILLSALLLVFLIFWTIIKEGLAGREVSFTITTRGIEVIPSSKQKNLDKSMRIITQIAFLWTLKGGQWSAFAPYTPWKKIRTVLIDEHTLQIHISGGVWDISLICTDDVFNQAVTLIRENAPRRARFLTSWACN